MPAEFLQTRDIQMHLPTESSTNNVLNMRGGIEHSHHGTELCRKYFRDICGKGERANVTGTQMTSSLASFAASVWMCAALRWMILFAASEIWSLSLDAFWEVEEGCRVPECESGLAIGRIHCGMVLGNDVSLNFDDGGIVLLP